MKVSAEDKGTGKSEKITITNDKGRLSQTEIERMIREAEENAEEDRKTKERIDAKNAFEGYLHSLKKVLDDKEKLADKLDAEDKSTIETAMKDGESWLSANPEADAGKNAMLLLLIVIHLNALRSIFSFRGK